MAQFDRSYTTFPLLLQVQLYLVQVALLSQRDRAMLRVCHQLHHNTSTASSTSDLTLRTLFCSVFVVVVHAAGCDKYRFTDALPYVHGGLSQLLFTGLARHQTIAKPVIVDDPDLCHSHLHSTPRYRGVPSPSDYCQFAMAFDAEKLEWFGYPTLKKMFTLYRFSVI